MTDENRIEIVLGDLFRASLDDCSVRLPPTTERKILNRMVELAETMGIEICRPDDDPNRR